MRQALLLLALVLMVALLGFVTSCDYVADRLPHPPGQDEATDIVAEVFMEDGLEDPRPVIVLWFEDRCLPEPWALGHGDCDPTVHDCRCFQGRAIYLIWGCVVAVRWHNDAISGTSFAHELAHCAEFDGWHDDRSIWEYTVPRANDALRAEGL